MPDQPNKKQSPQKNDPTTQTNEDLQARLTLRRNLTLQNLTNLGLSKENAQKMWLVLEQQDGEFLKRAHGKPKEFGGKEGLVMALQEASGLKPRKFLRKIAGMTRDNTHKMRNNPNYEPSPETFIKFINNLGLEKFSDVILKTAHIETRSVKQIVEDHCNSKERNYGQMLRDLRSAHCHDGENMYSWFEAIDKDLTASKYSGRIFAKELGITQTGLSKIELHGISPSRHKDQRALAWRLAKPKNIFGMEGRTLQQYDQVLSSSICRKKKDFNKNIDELCAEVTKEAGYKSLNLLLSKIVSSVAKTHQGIMSWQMAEERGLIPFEATVADLASPAGVREATMKKWVRASGLLPGPEPIVKMGENLHFLSGEKSLPKARAKMIRVFNDFKLGTIAHIEENPKPSTQVKSDKTGPKARKSQKNPEKDKKTPENGR